jgi:hypothetical protein
MVKHYTARIGDGENFENSKKYQIWGVKPGVKKISEVKPGDKIWFLRHKIDDITPAEYIAVADFVSYNDRELGPLLELSKSSDELKWIKGDEYTKEIHYTNVYDLIDKNIYPPENSCHSSIFTMNERYNNIIDEYDIIVRYLKPIKYT